MSTVPIKSKEFHLKEGSVQYPNPANYSGNPLYKTASMTYGGALPTNYDLPSKLCDAVG